MQPNPLIMAMQVLIPTSQFIRSLVAARLAADVCGVPTVLIARTDAHSANLLTADVDERDRPFVHGERTPEGFHQFHGGIKVRARSCHSCRLRWGVGKIAVAPRGLLMVRGGNKVVEWRWFPQKDGEVIGS